MACTGICNPIHESVHRKSDLNCDICKYKPKRDDNEVSKLVQVDGNISVNSELSSDANDDSDDTTEYDTEDEAFHEVTPLNLHPALGQKVTQGQPLIFDIDQEAGSSSTLPLCLLLNSRSIYNKSDNLNEMLNQIGPDLCLVSETFERERKRIKSVLKGNIFKSISYYRKNRAPGGGCAIIYNEN